MERCRRLILLLLAAALLIPLFRQGHDTSREESVAFLRPDLLPLMVRVTGDVRRPGIYRLPAEATVATVIIMTEPIFKAAQCDPGMLVHGLKNGDVVRLMSRGLQCAEIAVNTMKAKERMILGIPLHPDMLDADDWDALPGIGPALAEDIVKNRQDYGDFGRLENVERVRGMGKSKIARLRPYFQ